MNASSASNQGDSKSGTLSENELDNDIKYKKDKSLGILC